MENKVRFLGFIFEFGKRVNGTKAIYMRPSSDKVKALKERLREIFANSTNLNSYTLVNQVNPILRGWAEYYKISSASGIFSELSELVWRLQFGWALSKCPGRSKSYVLRKYFVKVGNSFHFIGKTKGMEIKAFRISTVKIKYHKVRNQKG